MRDANPKDDLYYLRRDLAALRRELLTLSETLSATTIMATARRLRELGDGAWRETSRYCGQDKREVVYVSPLGVAASCVGRAVVCGETMMSIEVARAKAACLLAAADEAEGAAPC